MPKSNQLNKAATLKELLAIKDVVSLLHPRTNRIIDEYAKTTKHVVLLPAYGTDKRYLKPLTKCLKRHGHIVYDWGLGVNDAGINRESKINHVATSWPLDPVKNVTPSSNQEMGILYLCSRMVKRLIALHDMIQMPITLVGWNLGGTIAMEVARDLPDQISQVITLGTPTKKDSTFTVAAKKLRRYGADLDWMEQQLYQREQTPIKPSVTAINGRYDGIISKNACQQSNNEYTQVFEERCSHIGLMYHHRVWENVLQLLSKAA